MRAVSRTSILRHSRSSPSTPGHDIAGYYALARGQLFADSCGYRIFYRGQSYIFRGTIRSNYRNYSIYSIESLKRAVMTDGPQVYGGGVQMFKSHEEQHKLARKFTRSIHSASMAPATVTHPLEATAVELFTMAYNRESNGFHLMRLGG